MVENHEMKNMSLAQNKKRKYRELITPHELTHKFSSKQDLHIYMSEHRKSNFFFALTEPV